ncbi:MAG: hypothetical protein ACLGIJ_13655 [Candidatus Limnocylindria bacterium]
MRKSLPAAIWLGLVILAAQAGLVLADSPDAGITVEPVDVTAGGTILLAGADLEPDDERILVLQGEDVTVDLGTATTDADGMLSLEVVIPAHLPTGVYRLQAIGDETLSVEVRITAAAGGAAVEPSGAEAAVSRERGPVELGSIVAAAAVLGALGLLLIVRAERFRGHEVT